MKLLWYRKPNFRKFQLALDTMCQLMKLNSKKTSRQCNFQWVWYTRVAECPILEFMTINFYSLIWCKSWIYVFFKKNYILTKSCLSFMNFCRQSISFSLNLKIKYFISFAQKEYSQYLLMTKMIKMVLPVAPKNHFHETNVAV